MVNTRSALRRDSGWFHTASKIKFKFFHGQPPLLHLITFFEDPNKDAILLHLSQELSILMSSPPTLGCHNRVSLVHCDMSKKSSLMISH